MEEILTDPSNSGADDHSQEEQPSTDSTTLSDDTELANAPIPFKWKATIGILALVLVVTASVIGVSLGRKSPPPSPGTVNSVKAPTPQKGFKLVNVNVSQLTSEIAGGLRHWGLPGAPYTCNFPTQVKSGQKELCKVTLNGQVGYIEVVIRGSGPGQQTMYPGPGVYVVKFIQQGIAQQAGHGTKAQNCTKTGAFVQSVVPQTTNLFSCDLVSSSGKVTKGGAVVQSDPSIGVPWVWITGAQATSQANSAAALNTIVAQATPTAVHGSSIPSAETAAASLIEASKKYGNLIVEDYGIPESWKATHPDWSLGFGLIQGSGPGVAFDEGNLKSGGKFIVAAVRDDSGACAGFIGTGKDMPTDFRVVSGPFIRCGPRSVLLNTNVIPEIDPVSDAPSS